MRVRPPRSNAESSVATVRERAVDLPFGFDSVAVARGRLASDLVASGILDPQRSDALVVLSELMANAVRHARPLPRGQVRASWRIEAAVVEIAVVDGGASTRPEATHPAVAAGSGRGLVIVGSLATAWGVDGAGTDRQRVWAQLPR
jgi:anti-sigma regulatory factor (Ser/Thr protein kinase)